MDVSGLEPALTCGTSIVYLLAEFEPLTMAVFGTRSWLRSKQEWCMRPLCTLAHLAYWGTRRVIAIRPLIVTERGNAAKTLNNPHPLLKKVVG